MLEDTSITSTEFPTAKFKTQDILTHTIQAIERVSNTQRLKSVAHIVFMEKKKLFKTYFIQK